MLAPQISLPLVSLFPKSCASHTSAKGQRSDRVPILKSFTNSASSPFPRSGSDGMCPLVPLAAWQCHAMDRLTRLHIIQLQRHYSHRLHCELGPLEPGNASPAHERKHFIFFSLCAFSTQIFLHFSHIRPSSSNLYNLPYPVKQSIKMARHSKIKYWTPTICPAPNYSQ